MLAEAFLSDFSADLLAVVGAVGVALTAIGVWLAWLQMSRTTEANTAATEAAIAATLSAKVAYQKHALNRIGRLLSEAITRIDTKDWSMAAMRIRDVADSLQDLGEGSEEWAKLTSDMHEMEGSLSRIGRGEIEFTKRLGGKWDKLQQATRSAIAAASFPFPEDEMPS